MPDFLPRREDKLLQWSINFDQKILFSPEQFGLSPQQSADYHILHGDYATLYQLANQNSTRTPSIITSKKTAMKSLKKMARALSGIARAHPQTTNTQRVELGLRPRKRTRTPIGRPTAAPGVRILDVKGMRVLIWVYDTNSPLRVAKPRGVGSALLYVFVGENPPTTTKTGCRPRTITRTRYEIKLGPKTQPGEKVWIAAQWLNPRCMGGPISPWATTHAQFGQMEVAARMKIAA